MLCRACQTSTVAFLSFGRVPLANSFVPPDVAAEDQERFPLTMAWCPSCSLVQLVETIGPTKLFRHYLYMASTSSTIINHAKALVSRMIGEHSLGAHSKVVEIASNDGYLLQFYKASGIPILGIEPATNIAEVARQRGIDTLCEFFSSDLARNLVATGERADVVHAHNVLAHVPDLTGFVEGLRTILKPDGVVVIEVPYLPELIDKLEFDTVYHEHICYFALSPLVSLFAAKGLQIFDVEQIPIHGGSLRLFARLADSRSPHMSVDGLLREERAWGVSDPATYHRFGEAVSAFPPLLRGFLADLRRANKSVAAYGAAAKGATLLNYCQIGRDVIDFVVDRSPIKHGLAMPGVQIPILPPEELLNRRPDFALLLAWNFAEEIMRQQIEYINAGGRFIVPVPTPKIM